MKISEYNAKAREALGKTFVDIGVSIFKGVISLFTVVPIALILKSWWDKDIKPFSIMELFSSITIGTYIVLLIFVFISMYIGAWFRDEGLKHIHEAEEIKKKTTE